MRDASSARQAQPQEAVGDQIGNPPQRDDLLAGVAHSLAHRVLQFTPGGLVRRVARPPARDDQRAGQPRLARQHVRLAAVTRLHVLLPALDRFLARFVRSRAPHRLIKRVQRRAPHPVIGRHTHQRRHTSPERQRQFGSLADRLSHRVLLRDDVRRSVQNSRSRDPVEIGPGRVGDDLAHRL